MTGKLIEIGDLECLQNEPEPNKSGVVVLIDREQLKASRNLFGETVHVGAASSGWKTTEPPKDGTEIVAIGKIMFTEDCYTAAEPFMAAIRWIKDDSGFDGWHLANGMALARAADDEVIIHWWIEYPKTDLC